MSLLREVIDMGNSWIIRVSDDVITVNTEVFVEPTEELAQKILNDSYNPPTDFNAINEVNNGITE